jgi:hypothetical protein
VLFISDGEDDHPNTLEQRLKTLKGNQGKTITFLCLGVESQFPLFMSMYLREVYHNTQGTIPALFLIEYGSDKAFFNKFEQLKQHFKGL